MQSELERWPRASVRLCRAAAAVLVLAILVACAKPAPVATVAPLTTATLVGGYPGQPPTENGASPAYPGPGATAARPSPIAATPVSPAAPPASKSGTAAISGVLYSYTIHNIIVQAPFYLTRAGGIDGRQLPPIIIGPDDKKGDIGGMSDDKGQFVVTDIPPGNWYLIVNAPADWIPAEISDKQQTPRLLELTADSQVSLGVVYLSYP